jgi:TrmH family RNA methyltransferase
MTVLRSKDNPKVKRWMRLATDARFRREECRALVEGPHLVEAAGGLIKVFLVAEGEGPPARDAVVLSRGVFNAIMDADTPQGIAAEIEIPKTRPLKGDSVYLEGIQDAGNVGAILRSASAFGIRTAYLDKQCADPWSPKVLRAGAGAHFNLVLVDGEPPDTVRLACTVVKGGTALGDADLSGPLCWVFGSEGKGASAEIQRKAALRVTIPIEAGTESLNVAAAAAICLYEAFSRRAAGS